MNFFSSLFGPSNNVRQVAPSNFDCVKIATDNIEVIRPLLSMCAQEQGDKHLLKFWMDNEGQIQAIEGRVLVFINPNRKNTEGLESFECEMKASNWDFENNWIAFENTAAEPMWEDDLVGFSIATRKIPSVAETVGKELLKQLNDISFQAWLVARNHQVAPLKPNLQPWFTVLTDRSNYPSQMLRK